MVKKGGRYEDVEEQINDAEPMLYRLGAPVPHKPIMVDFHSSPYSIVSQKIETVLRKLNIKGLQLIPTTIEGKDDELFENYFFLSIYKRLKALDMEKAVYDWDDFIEEASSIDKLALNEQFLNELPLEDRLVFRLQENPTFEIFHKSVVDAIMAVNPEGIIFTSVADWHR